VAQSRRRKTHRWLRSLFLFVITPLTLWILAFLVWLFWHDITRQVAPGKATSRPDARGFSPPSPSGRGKGEGAPSTRDEELDKNRDPQPDQRPREDIPDGDRKKLDDILNRR